jgi:transmembrane sensor
VNPFIASNVDEACRLTEAAAWRVRLTELGVERNEAFDAWLAGDPKAADAWRRVQALWKHFDDHAATPELMTARHDALDRALRGSLQKRHRPIQAMAAAAAACLVLAAGATWLLTRPQIYQTAPGERRTVTLADGSRITLDSASKVEVRYTGDARKIILAQGEARFDVAHDVQRPFSVSARDRIVVATGTAFDVDVASPAVRVTLIEGHVVVLQSKAPERSTEPVRAVSMQAGQQYVASADAAPQLTVVSMESATAWESGRIVVDDEPLGDVVQRVNRYAAKPVTIGDPTVSQLRLSGVFTAGDVDTFIDTVTHYLPVDAVAASGGGMRLNRRDKS